MSGALIGRITTRNIFQSSQASAIKLGLQTIDFTAKPISNIHRPIMKPDKEHEAWIVPGKSFGCGHK